MGYGPTLAEVLLLQGILHREAGRADAAVACLEEAVWSAELARDDEVAAEAATYIIYTTGYLQARFDLAETWCRHTEMLLRRMGEHDDLWGWYLNNRAAMRRAQGDLRRAIDDAREAIAAKARAFGSDSPDVGVTFSNLSGYLVEAGSISEGIEASARAIEILTAGLGPEHPKTAVALSNHSEWLCRTRSFSEAIGFAERALPILEREMDPNGLFVAHSLWVIGLVRLPPGPSTTAPCPLLERARRNREASNVERLGARGGALRARQGAVRRGRRPRTRGRSWFCARSRSTSRRPRPRSSRRIWPS